MGVVVNFAAIWGKLSWHAFPTDIITIVGAGGLLITLLIVAGLMTYFRKWGWLWRNWLTTLDPKKIGTMYIIVGILMLIRGGTDALMMRAQQATGVGPHAGVLGANLFQQVFSAHGTIMIFFAAMGIMFGLINWVLPLQIGARDVAFPFLNATSFWLFAAGAILINISLFVGDFSIAGWLAYPPLSELKFSPTSGVDYWIWSLEIAGVGSLLSGINFLVTIFKKRAPGMGLMKMPIFTWSVMGTLVLIIFAFPILTVTLTLLFLDRALGMHFFTAGAGGNMMMYVNLIWAWGHPEVYLLVLPAFGCFSEVVATYSRKALFGYKSMVWAIWGIVLLSFSVWLHHFFTMGAGADVNGFFGITTMIIAIPTGVKIFNWIFTMYQGKIRFTSPMIWFMGFVFLFTMGGVAGVMLAIPPVDFQLHNSLFLVAHFHTMIVTGVVFGYMAGLNFWFPKIFGFRLNDRIGKYAAYSWIVGFILAFGPLYILGFMGATRRLDHYPSGLGWQPLFIVAAIGVVIIALGVALQVLQLAVSIWKRNETRDLTGDPWDGRTLEWSTTSPPPEYNFAAIPLVHERDAFWEAKKIGVNLRDHPHHQRFSVPKNTSWAFAIGMLSLVLGFAAVWRMWWLAALMMLAIITTLIIRGSDEHPERLVKTKELDEAELAIKQEEKFA